MKLSDTIQEYVLNQLSSSPRAVLKSELIDWMHQAQALECRDTDCEDSYARAWLKSHSRQIIENGQRITVIERLVESIRESLKPK